MAPPLEARRAVVEAFAAEMRPLGISNFRYSDGELVFGHGHRRTQADGTVATGPVAAPSPSQRRPCCRDCAAGGVGRHHSSGRAARGRRPGNGAARQRAGDGWPLVAACRGADRRAVGRQAHQESPSAPVGTSMCLRLRAALLRQDRRVRPPGWGEPNLTSIRRLVVAIVPPFVWLVPPFLCPGPLWLSLSIPPLAVVQRASSRCCGSRCRSARSANVSLCGR